MTFLMKNNIKLNTKCMNIKDALVDLDYETVCGCIGTKVMLDKQPLLRVYKWCPQHSAKFLSLNKNELVTRI